MSPEERKYLEWLHSLTVEQASGSPYWHSRTPSPDGPTWSELRERDKFEKWRERERGEASHETNRL